MNPWNLPARLRRRLLFERAERRLDRDLDRLMESARRAYETRPDTGQRPKVAIATFGSGNWHLVLEVLLAHGLALRGAAPELLICDIPTLPACDERTWFDRDRTSCSGCLPGKRPILDKCGIPWRGLSTFVNEGALDRARQLVGELRDDEVADYNYGQRPLGRWTFVSACHFLRRDARSSDPENIAARRLFLTAGIVVADAVERWLDEVAPDVVVAESGAHSMWRTAFELARARGIRVVCREIGKGGFDSHIYSVNAECMFPNLDDVWTSARNVALSNGQKQAVAAFLQALPEKTYARERPADDSHPEVSMKRFRAGDRRVVLLFTNVTWDLATAGRDVGFDGMFDWLSETLAIAARQPDVQFVIRIHPAEEHVLTRERVIDWLADKCARLPANVSTIRADEPASVRMLAHAADLVVAYCSTTGIEAAMFGKPVVVAGAPHYRGKGFTIDVSSKADYHNVFASWSRGELQAPPDASELATRYFHLFFLRYHLAMGWTTSPLEPPFELTIREMSELLPGRNRAVDAVCEGILSGREILL